MGKESHTMNERELLQALRVAVEFFWKDKPDSEVVSVGTWYESVPGYPRQFKAQLALTVGDIRSATETATAPVSAREQE